MELIAALICLSASAKSHPTPPLNPSARCSLNQHHVGKLLRHQKAARQRIAQLLPHPLQRPAQRRLVRFFLEMHNGRQHAQQDAGMAAGECEVPADNKAIPSAIQRVNAATLPPRKNRHGVNRRQAQVGCKAEGSSARQ
jgi:hypothetical protein